MFSIFKAKPAAKLETETAKEGEIFLCWWLDEPGLEKGSPCLGMGDTRSGAITDMRISVSKMYGKDAGQRYKCAKRTEWSDLFNAWTRADIDNRRDGLGRLTEAEGYLEFKARR